MNKATIDLFRGFLVDNKEVFYHSESLGVFTIFLLYPDNETFFNTFNRWNENHGIVLSIVRITPITYIVYTGNGVKVTDLTKENI